MLALLYRLTDACRHYHRQRLWHADHASGRRGEDLAHRFLRKQGFVVVARNYRTRSGSGELDIVAWEGDTLVFVEVKSRKSEEFGSPDRAIDPEKQQHLVRAACDYVRRAGIEWERTRFDIISVVFTEPPSITHRRDAFAVRTTV